MSALGSGPRGDRVTAVLGPTNTGKTHLAVERMLGHRSGTIGLPLRLLAREVYDRVVRQRGARAVALITGEERIVPAVPAYVVCTVESMPIDRRPAFVAVDEIQLAADSERGHVFTDRILRARGSEETLFLGASTIAPHLRRLAPGIEFVTRPRFSTLSYTGSHKLRRLPPRSAIIAFSAADVYALAELVRRQRGGAAVVLGALSPRSRNAQVAMFEAGEVDYIVATDAIGMGLNLDLDHVAFAGTRKFDGQAVRDLSAAELAQIAGRAGRHMSDGSFGVTADARPLTPELVERIEGHRFEPPRLLHYRNAMLDYSTLQALLRSLQAPPPDPGLVRSRDADDERALRALAATTSIADMTRSPAAVRLLWEVCRIPDFRKTMAEAHTSLLAQIYRHLMSAGERLPADWVADQVARLDRIEGDVDTLATRIAHVRTWSYISHRGEWLSDARAWQERVRALEGRLSDALHQRLTQRFVDRRAATLTKRLKDNVEPLVSVAGEGDVLVEGYRVGELRGLRYRPDPLARGGSERTLRAAANRVLGREITARAVELARAPDVEMALGSDGQLSWKGAAVANLVRGVSALGPGVRLLPGDLPPGPDREGVRRRLVAWLDRHLRRLLAPLHDLGAAAKLSPAGRGLAFRLQESLGSLPRRAIAAEITALDHDSRARMRARGVRFGATSVFLPAMMKPERIAARWMLWAVHAGLPRHAPPPPPGMVSIEVDPRVAGAHYEAAGFRVCGRRAVRIDMLERLAAELRRRVASPAPLGDHRLLSLVGCGRDDFVAILDSLGYRSQDGGDGRAITAAPPTQRRDTPRTRPSASPFAALGGWSPADTKVE